jgi:hypothetical protein
VLVDDDVRSIVHEGGGGGGGGGERDIGRKKDQIWSRDDDDGASRLAGRSHTSVGVVRRRWNGWNDDIAMSTISDSSIFTFIFDNQQQQQSTRKQRQHSEKLAEITKH